MPTPLNYPLLIEQAINDDEKAISIVYFALQNKDKIREFREYELLLHTCTKELIDQYKIAQFESEHQANVVIANQVELANAYAWQGILIYKGFLCDPNKELTKQYFEQGISLGSQLARYCLWLFNEMESKIDPRNEIDEFIQKNVAHSYILSERARLEFFYNNALRGSHEENKADEYRISLYEKAVNNGCAVSIWEYITEVESFKDDPQLISRMIKHIPANDILPDRDKIYSKIAKLYRKMYGIFPHEFVKKKFPFKNSQAIHNFLDYHYKIGIEKRPLSDFETAISSDILYAIIDDDFLSDQEKYNCLIQIKFEKRRRSLAKECSDFARNAISNDALNQIKYKSVIYIQLVEYYLAKSKLMPEQRIQCYFQALQAIEDWEKITNSNLDIYPSDIDHQQRNKIRVCLALAEIYEEANEPLLAAYYLLKSNKLENRVTLSILLLRQLPVFKPLVSSALVLRSAILWLFCHENIQIDALNNDDKTLFIFCLKKLLTLMNWDSVKIKLKEAIVCKNLETTIPDQDFNNDFLLNKVTFCSETKIKKLAEEKTRALQEILKQKLNKLKEVSKELLNKIDSYRPNRIAQQLVALSAEISTVEKELTFYQQNCKHPRNLLAMEFISSQCSVEKYAITYEDIVRTLSNGLIEKQTLHVLQVIESHARYYKQYYDLMQGIDLILKQYEISSQHAPDKLKKLPNPEYKEIKQIFIHYYEQLSSRNDYIYQLNNCCFDLLALKPMTINQCGILFTHQSSLIVKVLALVKPIWDELNLSDYHKHSYLKTQ